MNPIMQCISLNIVLKCTYIICVTAAAIYFNSAAILWWYLLVFLLGYDYTPKKEGQK